MLNFMDAKLNRFTVHCNYFLLVFFMKQNDSNMPLKSVNINHISFSSVQLIEYTPTQWGNYHHGTSSNPTTAVNLFLIGKQYLTFCKTKASAT